MLLILKIGNIHVGIWTRLLLDLRYVPWLIGWLHKKLAKICKDLVKMGEACQLHLLPNLVVKKRFSWHFYINQPVGLGTSVRLPWPMLCVSILPAPVFDRACSKLILLVISPPFGSEISIFGWGFNRWVLHDPWWNRAVVPPQSARRCQSQWSSGCCLRSSRLAR